MSRSDCMDAHDHLDLFSPRCASNHRHRQLHIIQLSNFIMIAKKYRDGLTTCIMKSLL